MSFFQNVFLSDFEGNWILGDRQHGPKFVCPRNIGRGDELVVSWADGPYDLSGNDAAGNSKASLYIQYALRDPKNWATLTINIAAGAADASAVTTAEVITNLNANTIFAERFVATLGSYDTNGYKRILIRQKKPITEFRFYIVNGYAEEALKFNARAGVAELPTYFSRHTMANRFSYEDSQNHLILLDVGNAVDAAVINNAVDVHGRSKSFSSATVQTDWQLLEGRAGIFQFQKGPSGNAVSSTETVIYYSAGSKVGDLAKKVITQKDASSAIVAQYEIPYTLTSGDLVTPP